MVLSWTYAQTKGGCVQQIPEKPDVIKTQHFGLAVESNMPLWFRSQTGVILYFPPQAALRNPGPAALMPASRSYKARGTGNGEQQADNFSSSHRLLSNLLAPFK